MLFDWLEGIVMILLAAGLSKEYFGFVAWIRFSDTTGLSHIHM